ncbi:autophagy-related protein 2 homolog A isoform X1 [Trachemys scripta elegans]|uniref:autophagy-related protein 2 homolog A isoform X1 n=1 Tax=Trachemys scripta elegans TaxID=31138 RepID=UPI00155190E5|nr:autophagy-related protein 2 homolog A isoform X1 [Trachemys scripta elegans]
MSRWFFPWSSSIKKRACRYLLQHYLGHYLEERLSLEQLSLDLYQGAGALRDIHLDIWSVNELLESVSAPLEIVDGFINSIAVTIPWSALVTENCTVEVTGLQITCRPKYRSATPGTESQSWSSCMTTSMQLAQECLKDQAEEPPQPLEGLEMFAQTIETVLRRIKVTFLDTIVRMEHVPSSSQTGVALEVHIKRLDYCDEAVKDPNQVLPVDIHQPPAFVHKILQLSGMQLYYEEFPESAASPVPGPQPQPQMSESLSSASGEAPEGPDPPLQIGSCSGYMEMRIKLKQNEAFPGPRLELDGKLGSLHLLVSPQQIFFLHDLLTALSVSEANGLQEKLSKSRPLDSEDLKLIEQDLSQQLHGGQGLGPGRLEEELESFVGLENREMFFSMAAMTSSVTSMRSVSDLSDIELDSSVHSDYSACPLQPPSFAPGLILSSPRRYGRSPFAATLPGLQGLSKLPGKAPQLPSLESLRPETLLRVTVGGLTLTVPHQCPGPPAPPHLAQHFFAELAFFKDSAFGGRDFGHLRQCFEKACPCSNLRLTGAALQVTCQQRAAGSLRVLSSEVSFGMLEILECLWASASPERRQQKPEYTELMTFKNPSAFTYNSSARPCAQIHYKQSEKLPSKSNLKKAGAKRSSELLAELAEFHSDVDLGVLDRLGSLLHLAASASMQDQAPGLHADMHVAESLHAPERHTTVRLAAPKATLRLQFPVPDLRPEPERQPWMEKAVRKENLRLELTDVVFQTELRAGPGGHGEPTRLEVTLSDLHGLYEDGERLSVPCIRVSKALDPAAKGPGKKYLFPKIMVTLTPQHSLSHWDLAMDKEEMDLSMVESPCELRRPEPSPFSSKRTMYETEEMVIPGDPEEMADFQAKTVAASQYVLEVTLPSVHIFLPSKEIYESIYNRINNDLLMWEPTSPFLCSSGPAGGAAPGTFFSSHPPPPKYWQDNFKMCKSAFKLDSDSEDEDSHFYSVDEAVAQRRKGEQLSLRQQSRFSAVVSILKGRVTALCEAKGEAGKKLDDSHGEIVLDVDNCTIFSVSQYKGQEELGYLCIESERVTLYHKAVVEDYFLASRLEIPSFTPPDRLHPTIYSSEEGVLSGLAGGRKDRPLKMLSAAIRINLDLKKNIKEFLVTLRLEGATMRHHMALTNQSWYTQLIDFLDVLDDPILGFVPPTVITVLHTHLFCCAVDYRPLYLPVRVLITAETFTLSSNIIVDTSIFLLRFILDDSAIYLSDKCDVETVDLRKDYVCVLDVDLLELVITTWKGSADGKLTQPLFELRCSNNVVHLHTCADSCAMLANLIQYVVNHGDLHPPPRQDSPTEIAGQKVQLSESPASLPSCLPAETATINQRDLTDALIDTDRSLRDLTLESGEAGQLHQTSPVSVYLFPGENSAGGKPCHPPPAALPPTPMEVGLDFCSSEGSEEESEATDNDDFCILDAPGMGIPPKDGEPVVTKLLEGPVPIKDGYFSRPLGSTDLLKAPAHFPLPESRVMLREISVVWHLYGGRDFGVGRAPPGHAHSPRMRPGLSSARSSPSRSSMANRPQNTWRTQGGTGRLHDLLMEIQLTKVSFQHETYPSGAEKLPTELEEQPVSRQVFIVQELEIRDRLASSQINKFLYLYTSEKMPRRAHSNMLTIKALHVCPEAGLGGPECCLRVSLLPLRLNIDQDALFFLKDFFTSLAVSINPVLPMEAGTEARPDPGVRASPATESESLGKEQEGSRGPGLVGVEMTASVETTLSENSSSSNASSSTDQPIYFREFRFTSEVPIWLDYHGKHMTMDQVGTFAGILIGLAQLNCSELKLKRLCCRHGLLGVDKVISYALTEWLTDIRKNQLPGILGGVGPMHSVVQLFHGLRDLFWLPIEQYRKDGRIIRGLQRGAASFGTSTASAALELSNRLVQAIQATAETVYDILSPTSPVTRTLLHKKHARKLRRGQQPADLREGVAKAYDTFREGVIDTAQTICDVAARGHEQKGITGAVGGVLRQIPPTVVKPLIVASEATSNLLGGMRNQIKPDARKEESLKWRLEESQD